jgi:lipoyl(octanoyl) transferase
LNVKQLVDKATQSVIDLLVPLGIPALDDDKNPGVYVNNQKIASLGFRVRKHMSYHGVAINHAMDLRPFKLINPCGRQQQITQISQFCSAAHLNKHQILHSYLRQITKTFAFDNVIVTGNWPTAASNA